MRFSTMWGALSALVVCAGLSTQANATLALSVNGSTLAIDGTNAFAYYSGAIGAWTINQIQIVGVSSFGGNGMLTENSSLNVSTNGQGGSLTILLIETDLTADAPTTFLSTFTGQFANAAATRSFYVDPTNNGLMTTLLGSTSLGNKTFAQVLDLPGMFSLTEQIVLTASGTGAYLSSDDSVRVPEPTSLGILGIGMLGLRTISRRRRQR